MELKYKLYALFAFIMVLLWNVLIDFDVLPHSAFCIGITIILAVVLSQFLHYEILITCQIRKTKYSKFLIIHIVCLVIFVSINYLLQKNIIQDFGMSGTKMFLMIIFGIYLFSMFKPMFFKETYDSLMDYKP